MKKVLVIGASGLLGKNIVKLLADDAEVITASLSDPNNPVDISNTDSIKSLFENVGLVDAVICTAGIANFADWNKAADSDWSFAISNKLMGQINIIRHAMEKVKTGGAIVLTTGILAQYPMPGSSIVSTVNAGLEAAIKTLKVELDGSVRIGAISPGWIAETLVAMGMDEKQGMPAIEVAQAYIDYLNKGNHGDIVVTSSR
ncbi:short chain dehydrogenase [Thalassotalea loyana]|uniref:Short chain dehydrogenase n=1 Tax=Thalassotalea loyana TaxID=280483 RepID=A0ABQ6HFH8_9GAMM|nr:short chain dehydrogenase [Thalassotalea loyana]GLX85487.1 short chain dehydrogenase [Thalassotalea loyana]